MVLSHCCLLLQSHKTLLSLYKEEGAKWVQQLKTSLFTPPPLVDQKYLEEGYTIIANVFKVHWNWTLPCKTPDYIMARVMDPCSVHVQDISQYKAAMVSESR